MLNSLECAQAGRCTGCAWINLPYLTQREQKQALISQLWGTRGPLPPIEWVTIAVGGLRDRTDLMISTSPGSSPQVGLLASETRDVLDLPQCPQLSPRLHELLTAFREHIPPVTRGSVRLRLAPDGKWGVWLDLANLDIKVLLEDQTQLRALMKFAIVEVGQKRKRVIEKDGRLKLDEPILAPWFETYAGSRAIPLYCTIGSFTQPGFQANQALVATLTQHLEASDIERVIEFGSGIGNFTLPLAAQKMKVTACEMDDLACQALERSLSEQNLAQHVEVKRGNFQLHPHKWNLKFSDYDAVLVDPPRSGLMHFLDPLLESSDKPRWFFYVSCFAESFVRDSERLLSAGYELRKLSLVDQFPQSPHFEIVSTFELQK